MNGLRLGVLRALLLCRSDVHSKIGVKMVILSEDSITRLHNERGNGSGEKSCRQNFPRQSVLG